MIEENTQGLRWHEGYKAALLELEAKLKRLGGIPFTANEVAYMIRQMINDLQK